MNITLNDVGLHEVPFGIHKRLMPDSRYILRDAMMSGLYRSASTKTVLAGEYIGTDAHTGEPMFSFIKDSKIRNRTPVIGYVARFELLESLSGMKKSLYMSKEEMLEWAEKTSCNFDRQTYSAYQIYLRTGKWLGVCDLQKCSSPWYSRFDDMGEKVVLNRLLYKFGVHGDRGRKITKNNKEEPTMNTTESLIDRLIKGKISIWCDTKKKAQRVIDGFHAKGVKGSPAVEEDGADLAPCSFGLSLGGRILYSKDRLFFQRAYKCSVINCPVKQPDKLTAVRDGNDIVLTYKQHGKVVKQERVTKYYKDTDDFLRGSFEAMKKMIGEKPVAPKPEIPENFYHPGDKVLVRDDLVAGGDYSDTCSFVTGMLPFNGTVVTLKKQDGSKDWAVEESEFWFTTEMFVGKIVPAADLKEGDEVLVKGVKDGNLDSFQAPYANKIIRVDGFCGSGCCVIHNGVYFAKDSRLVGKLVRPNQKA